jgi:hypothetical protein
VDNGSCGERGRRGGGIRWLLVPRVRQNGEEGPAGGRQCSNAHGQGARGSSTWSGEQGCGRHMTWSCHLLTGGPGYAGVRPTRGTGGRGWLIVGLGTDTLKEESCVTKLLSDVHGLQEYKLYQGKEETTMMSEKEKVKTKKHLDEIDNNVKRWAIHSIVYQN